MVDNLSVDVAPLRDIVRVKEVTHFPESIKEVSRGCGIVEGLRSVLGIDALQVVYNIGSL